MMDKKSTHLLCPSAQPDMAEPRIFGVVGGTPSEPRVAYLDKRASLDLSDGPDLGTLKPTEVFRIAARCEERGCSHFRDQRCSLAQRLVDRLLPVVDRLPRCTIRRSCRWYAEQGAAACERCPQVATLATEKMASVVNARDPAN